MKALDKFVDLGFSFSTPDAKIIDCRESIRELQNERDSLIAELHKANSVILDLQRDPPKLTKKLIADIEAEAGRAGFIAGAEMWSDYGVKYRYKDDYLVDIEADASKYAAKIRNGEIK